jgi:hypothetical protein
MGLRRLQATAAASCHRLEVWSHSCEQASRAPASAVDVLNMLTCVCCMDASTPCQCAEDMSPVHCCHASSGAGDTVVRQASEGRRVQLRMLRPSQWIASLT